MARILSSCIFILLLSACPKPAPMPDAGVGRCEVDLSASGHFALGGAGASAKVIDSEAQLIGGPQSTGRPGDVRDSLANIDKARRVLGYRGAVTFREGLEKAIGWYVENLR